MDHTFVNDNSLKSLEDLAIFLTSGMLTLMTLQNIQVKSIQLGIMKEEMNERANTIIWDIRRQLQLYQIQLEATLELLPDDFKATPILERLKTKEIALARSMMKKEKPKKAEKS